MVHNTQQTIDDRIQYLRENSDFISAVFESFVGYASMAADFNGNIFAYNEGAHQICGYTPDEVIDRKYIESFFPGEFIAEGRFKRVVFELLEKGQIAFEGEMLRKNGMRFPAHLHFTLTRD